MIKHVNCPTCNKSIPWSKESEWRPFCCERCKLIDLGAWFEEEHKISEPADPDMTIDFEPPIDR